MDSIREIAILFSAAAILSAAMSLLGGGSMKKSIKYITALILLCSLVTGVAKSDFKFPEVSAAASSQSANEIELCRFQAEYMIKELLFKNDIKFEEISAVANKSEDNSIIISEITVKGVDEKEKVANLLASFGIDCRVIFK